MTLETARARMPHSATRIQTPMLRPSTAPVAFLALAQQLRADAQLHRALQVPGTALLGVAFDGVPLLIRLASPDVTHVLISGCKASGKTELVRTILASLVLFQRPRELQLFPIASRPHAYQFLETLPHLNGDIAATPEEALQRLRWLETEMERRASEGVARPRLIVVADGMSEMVKEGGREFQVHLTRLAQRGRAAGVSLIVAGRDGDNSALNGILKSYFPVRLAGRTAQAARSSVPGRGEFVLYAGGERVLFQAAYLAPDDVPALVAQARTNLESRAKPASFGLRTLVRRWKR
ncbi:MAG: hypothetical protein HY741_28455 [Chloroflexi bacterium]|nr:hypothetical protein [Chloroflexota bacterium]